MNRISWKIEFQSRSDERHESEITQLLQKVRFSPSKCSYTNIPANFRYFISGWNIADGN